jgi:hypothetical protein
MNYIVLAINRVPSDFCLTIPYFCLFVLVLVVSIDTTKDSNLMMLNIETLKQQPHSTVTKSSILLDSSHHIVYQSCRRTVADEEFRLMRFQVFCFLIGAIAFMSVRRQKAQHASLFDQRYIHGSNNNSNTRRQTATTTTTTAATTRVIPVGTVDPEYTTKRRRSDQNTTCNTATTTTIEMIPTTKQPTNLSSSMQHATNREGGLKASINKAIMTAEDMV